MNLNDLVILKEKRGTRVVREYLVQCSCCGKNRWIRKRDIKIMQRNLCLSCSRKRTMSAFNNKRNTNGQFISNGYKYIKLTQSSSFFSMANKCGWIREHRLNMAQHLGRSLRTWEIVHHINGNKLDNKIVNLQLIKTKEHTILNPRLKLSTICPECNNEFYVNHK